MITYEKFELANGLRFLVHEDESTPMAAVNILYNVGSRDESPDRTGFAHLFEHLMFGGSKNIPEFDDPLQHAGGDGNAFTNNDITNFYDTIPAENLETVFWLESDRMLSLRFSKRSLNVQKKVVVEEFKETCLNEPYGDLWHHINDMAYTKHPYRWPTIGLEPRHIKEATLEDVEDFFYKHYGPNNAIIVVAGKVKLAEVKALAEKWFGEIPAREVPPRQLPVEPPQTEMKRRRVQQANVPAPCLYIAFKMPPRMERDFYVTDLISDALANGRSSRLYQQLLKEQRLFSQIDAYVTGNIDAGLFIIEGRPSEGISLETAEAAVWKILDDLKENLIEPIEMEKLQNQMESTLVFSEYGVLNKATNLAFFELLGDASLINTEAQIYTSITTEEMRQVARQIFRTENTCVLYYLPL